MTHTSDNGGNGNGEKPGKRNALVHGIYATDMTLPWESPDELEKLEADLVAELKPEGCAERQAVGDLLRCIWNKRRVMRMTQIGFKDPATRDPNALVTRPTGELDYVEKIINLEARIDGRMDKALGRLASLKEFKRFEASKVAAKQLTASPSIAPELDSSQPNASDGDVANAERDNPPAETQPQGDTK